MKAATDALKMIQKDFITLDCQAYATILLEILVLHDFLLTH